MRNVTSAAMLAMALESTAISSELTDATLSGWRFPSMARTDRNKYDPRTANRSKEMARRLRQKGSKQ